MQLNFGPAKEPEYTGGKKVLATALSAVRFGYQYGFIPYVIYLGLKQGAEQGMPELSIFSVIW